jgi:GNAT superfamily N-acetyltransferase
MRSRAVAEQRDATLDGQMTVLPVTPARLADLADLFESNGSTKGCWCMAFIVTNREYHIGWYGLNRERFEQLAHEEEVPMGLLAYEDSRPVGWCAAGPRSRFERAIGPRNTMLKDRNPSEDDDVWLVPCFFVRVGFRRAGTTRNLLEAAVQLASTHGATAVEGFPLADDNPTKADGYYGRERLFAAQGFRCIVRPTPKRAVMRLDLPPRVLTRDAAKSRQPRT